MKNIQKNYWERNEKLNYVFKGETPRELLDNITKLSKETNCYDKNDVVMPPIGMITIPKDLQNSWLSSIIIFSGWKVVKEK